MFILPVLSQAWWLASWGPPEIGRGVSSPSHPTESLASAALRHLADARRLLTDQGEVPASPDQSWHLAGFGPECARKATLADEELHKILGHDLADEALVGWVLALDPEASATMVGEAPDAIWRPDHRYEATGTRNPHDAHTLLERCEESALQTLCFLWAAGRLKGERC